MRRIEYDQIAMLRLENGDYFRVMHERYSPNVVVMLGETAPGNTEHVDWRWTVDLSLAGLTALQREIANVVAMVSATTLASLQQRYDQVCDLLAQQSEPTPNDENQTLS